MIGFNDIVKVAEGCGLVRVGEGFLEVLRQSLSFLFWVSSVGNASPMDDLHRTVSTHHREFGRRPSNVVVASNVLARHDVVRTAVGLAQDDRQFGNGGFGKGVEEFGTVADDATPFLIGTREETGNVLKGQDGDVERVAESNEAGGFVAGIDVEAASEDLGLVRNHTDGMATEVAKPDHDVLSPVGLNFHETTIVQHFSDDIQHVVGFGRVVGDDAVKGVARTVLAVRGFLHRRALKVVGRQQITQVSSHLDGVFVIAGGKVGHARLRAVGGCTAEVFETDHFVGDRLDDLGTGDEHVGRLVDHDDEIRDGRRVHGTACTRPHDDRNLRDDAGSSDVAEENLGVGTEGRHAFLDASAAGIVHANDGTTGLQRHVEHLADLEAVHLTQGAAVDGEILSESKHFSPVDGAMTGDHAVAGNDVLVHVKIPTAVFNQRIDLLETAVVKEEFKSLSSRHLAAVVLRFDAGLAAASLASSLAIS